MAHQQWIDIHAEFYLRNKQEAYVRMIDLIFSIPLPPDAHAHAHAHAHAQITAIGENGISGGAKYLSTLLLLIGRRRLMELIASSRGGVKVIVMVWFHGEYYCCCYRYVYV